MNMINLLFILYMSKWVWQVHKPYNTTHKIAHQEKKKLKSIKRNSPNLKNKRKWNGCQNLSSDLIKWEGFKSGCFHIFRWNRHRSNMWLSGPSKADPLSLSYIFSTCLLFSLQFYILQMTDIDKEMAKSHPTLQFLHKQLTKM